MRVLASYRKIDTVRHHPNADALDIVTIDGWECVSKRDSFVPGDIAVYFEIGSLLPVKPQFEFLRKNCFKKTDSGEGFRIKTCKLRGEISQGLVVPLSKLPEISSHIEYLQSELGCSVEAIIEQLIETENNDLTEILGVVKYETPVRNTGNGLIVGAPRGNFPDFIPKTDQERLQNNYNKYSSIYKNDTFEVTLKLDGSSMTIYHVNGEDEKRGICSRNNDLDIDIPMEDIRSHFLKVGIQKGLLDALSEYCRATGQSLALQGELMGPGVQKNRESLDDHYFYLFDIFDISNQKYLDSEERQNVYWSLLDINDNFRHVPIIRNIELFEEFGNIQDICNWVDGAPSIEHKYAEGYVFKHLTKSHISFKVISRNYLLNCDTED